MPELPEVETVVRGLRSLITGQTIQRAEVYREKTVPASTPEAFAAAIQGHTIKSVTRRAKYLLFQLEPESVLLGHLRMTGKFVVADPPSEPAPHDRAWFWLGSGQILIFTDMRNFGTLELFPSANEIPKLQVLGPEPLTDDFDTRYLYPRLKASSKEIKPFLLDQRLVAGIGNIYASEILFASGVLPQRSSHSLKKKEVQAIVENTRRILLSAIEYNGTSVSDFRQVDEKTGEFQNFLQVYDKESQPCPRCEVPLQRIVQQQRSTFFCIGCQK